MEKTHPIVIFTDGACSGNPGPGGWGSIVVTPDGKVTELGGEEKPTTNNRMEMMAVVRALDFVAEQASPVAVYTDSTYLIRGITQWIWGWRKRGWKTAEGKDVLNKDIWEHLADLVQARKGEREITWHYSRGHVGIPGNERCDVIAVAHSRGEKPALYRGPLLKYSVDIMDIPEDTSLPEIREKTEKKVAFSYLSNIGGTVTRHKDWGSCEKRVKGQSGARFKKAMSVADETEILKSWGLDPGHSVKES
jgi:ribonuclease HI